MTTVKAFPTSPLSYLADSSFHRWASNPQHQGYTSENTPFRVLRGDIKQAGLFFRTNQYGQLADFFSKRGISRSPHPLWQFATAYNYWIAPLKEKMVWRALEAWTEKLMAALIESGFVTDGFLRKIRNAEEGVAFVTIVCQNLPPDWDFLDALSYFHESFKSDSRYGEEKFDFFGPWTPLDQPVNYPKDINATLRSYALYKERYKKDHETMEERKLAALVHPMGNRASILEIARRRLEKGKKAKLLESKMGKKLPFILPRLRIETFVMDWHLQHNPDWLDRLFFNLPEADRNRRREELKRTNEGIKGSIAFVTQALVG